MLHWSAVLAFAALASAAGHYKEVTIAHPSPIIAKETVTYGDGPAGVAIAAAHGDSYAAPLPGVTKTQYHAQDELGQYAYGYSEPNQIKEERKFYDGTVIGSYSYNSPDGRVVTNNYVADDHGFRSNLAPTLHKDNSYAVAREAAKVAAATAAYRAPYYAGGYASPAYYQAPAAVVEESYPHAPVPVARKTYVAEPTIVEKAYVAPAPAVVHQEYVAPAPAVSVYKTEYVAPAPAYPVAPAAVVEKEYVHSVPDATYTQHKSYRAGPDAVSHRSYIQEHAAPAPVHHVSKSYHAGPAVVHKEYVAPAPAVVHKEYVAPAPAVVHKEYAAPAVGYGAPAVAVHKEYVAPAPAVVHKEYAAPAVGYGAPAVAVHKEYAAPGPVVHKKEYHEPAVVAKQHYVDPYHGVAKEHSYVAKPGVSVSKTVVDPPPRTVSLHKTYRSDPYSHDVYVEKKVVDPAPQVHVEKTYHKPAVAHTKTYHGHHPYGGSVSKTYVEPGHQVRKSYVHQGPADVRVEVERSSTDPYGAAAYAARKFGSGRSYSYRKSYGGVRPFRKYYSSGY